MRRNSIGCLVSACSSVLGCLQSDGFPSRETGTMARTAQEPHTSHYIRAPVTDSMDTILYVVERTEILLGFNELVVHAKLAAAI